MNLRRYIFIFTFSTFSRFFLLKIINSNEWFNFFSFVNYSFFFFFALRFGVRRNRRRRAKKIKFNFQQFNISFNCKTSRRTIFNENVYFFFSPSFWLFIVPRDLNQMVITISPVNFNERKLLRINIVYGLTVEHA